MFIYALEPNPHYLTVAKGVLDWIDQPKHTGVTSTLSLTEILAKPYAALGDWSAGEIFTVLTDFPNLEWIAPGIEIARTAAKLRATYKMKTPDAIQAATALNSGATALITNDQTFSRLGLKTILLDDLL